MSGERPLVHAATVNWNKYEDTAACLRSLQRSEHPLARILVLDNGSSDGSAERLEREFAGTGVAFLRNRANEGYARGMNACLRESLAAGADLVFAVNNDTEVDPRCVGLLVQALAADPAAGLAGPAILYHSRPQTVWQGGGRFSRLRAGLVVPAKGRDASTLPAHPERVTFLTGCALLVARRTLEQAGFLDADFHFYVEDVEFGLRARDHGLQLLFVPGARVWHRIEDVARDRTSPFVLYNLGRSWTLLFRKRFRAPYRWYALALQYLLYTPHRVYQMLRGGAPRASYAAWLQGLRDGARGRAPAWRSPD